MSKKFGGVKNYIAIFLYCVDFLAIKGVFCYTYHKVIKKEKLFMEIGIITKPQALKGQFRVKPTNMHLLDMKNVSAVIIKGKHYDVEKIVLRDGFAIFKVVGLDNINDVEPLRNTPIYIEDIEDEELGEDEYYIDDMIGCKVVSEDGLYLGDVTSVNSYGGASVISMEKDGVEIMFPHARGVIKSVDVDNKIITVVKSILEEMSL